jgi:hypothetical protein
MVFCIGVISAHFRQKRRLLLKQIETAAIALKIWTKTLAHSKIYERTASEAEIREENTLGSTFFTEVFPDPGHEDYK